MPLCKTWTCFGFGALVGVLLFSATDPQGLVAGTILTDGGATLDQVQLAKAVLGNPSSPNADLPQDSKVSRDPVPTSTSTTTALEGVCALPLCQLHKTGPQLFILEHTDGAGHRMKSVLEAIAIAWRNKMNFGGLVGQLQPLTDQHINFRIITDAIFGEEASKELYIYNISNKPSWAGIFNDVRQLEGSRTKLKDSDFVYCHAVNEWGYDRSIPTSSYFAQWLRDDLRKHLDLRPLLFAPGKVSVVIHLRRADLERDDTRATADSYYYRLAKEIADIIPSDQLDFHVWSSPKNIPAFDYDYWTSKDYDGYRERGMTVHLDEKIDNNDDMLVAWTHMARASILIMSQSSFSMVPAYMNTNCVIFPSNIDAPLENWVNGRDESRASYQQEFKACVARGQKNATRLPSSTGAFMEAVAGPSEASPSKSTLVDLPEAEKEKRCQLKVCNLHDLSAPRIYILEHTDGAGHRMKSILEAIAVGLRNGLNFGGLVGQLQPLTDQHINFRVIVDAVFGSDGSSNLFYYNISATPTFAKEFENVRELQAAVAAGTVKPETSVYVKAVNEWGYDGSVKRDRYFPSWLRDEFRRHLDALPVVFAPGKVSVVIHLRRSDLQRDDTRATADSYYYRLAEDLQKLLPEETLDFHVWSSPKNIPAYDYDFWSSKDYDGYRKRNMTVHLDKKIDNNQDMLKAWTHMARADILIMSQSSFSMVPAYMNMNCVIFPSNLDSPLDNWMDGKDNKLRSKYQGRLKTCVDRALESQTEDFLAAGCAVFWSRIGWQVRAAWVLCLILAQAASVQLRWQVRAAWVLCLWMGSELLLVADTFVPAAAVPGWALCGLLGLLWLCGCGVGWCVGAFGLCPKGSLARRPTLMSPPRPTVRDFPFSPKQD
eukprot:s159_g21.t1